MYVCVCVCVYFLIPFPFRPPQSIEQLQEILISYLHYA